MRCGRSGLRHSHTARARLAVPNETSIAAAAPAMPRFGNGSQPSVSAPDRGICTSAVPAKARAGASVLPLPRSRLASVFAIHTSTAPPKITFE